MNMNKRSVLAAMLLLVCCLLTAACSATDTQPAATQISSTDAPTAVPVMPGDTLFFGHYEQDADPDNGPEAIEWLVLTIQGDHAVLISKYGLDAQPYHAKAASVTWENSSLRQWLNQDFYLSAFTPAEQRAIQTTSVNNNDSRTYLSMSIIGGSNTQDKVYLLSYPEAARYFGASFSSKDNVPARVEPTAYARARGAKGNAATQTASGTDAGWWWLRSPGGDQAGAALVGFDGAFTISGVSTTSVSVRPVINVTLDALR